MITTAILLVTAFILLWLLQRIARTSATELDLPPELHGATIAYSEKLFETMTPFHLLAKVDRIYRKGNMHFVLEFKTRARHRVYQSDIIELSAQRLAITGSCGLPVSVTGFVTTQVEGERQTHRVQLLDADQLVALYERRRAILAGTVEPNCNAGYALCASCSYRTECEPGAKAVHQREVQRYGQTGHLRSGG